MTNRFPLILDADSQKVRELPSGDNLDLTGNNIVAVRDIIPEANETYDLGSDTNRWKDLYLSGNSIIMNGGKISYSEQDGFVFSKDGTPTTISLDANSTDDLDEGTGNLYFTTARARDSVSASGDLSYNTSTGVFSVTTYKSSDFDTDFSGKSTSDLTEGTNLYFTTARARDSISVTGDLTYDPSTGVLGVDVPEGYDSSDFDTDFSGKSTSDLTEGTNLYFTTARVDAHLSGGTGVTYTAGEISIGQAVATTDNVQFNDLVVTGDLTVQGSQTILETATLQVEDQNIELGKVATPTNATADTGGITVLAGTDGDKTWKWLSATSSWTSSEHIDLADGKEYKINGNLVLDSSGSVPGNAGTATALQTARNINGISFDGTANITVPGNFADRTTNESGHAVFISTTATGNQEMFTNANYRFNPSTGELSATDFNSTSDINLKDNVADIENALTLVSEMRGVKYTWKDNGIAGVGVIAQEMEQVLPEVVSESGNHKTVSYGNVVGVLIEAIKELKAEVEELKRDK